MLNTKDKGNIGEAVILSEFVKRNIQVSIPFGDNARYDLIAEFNNKLNKIQIKYCSEIIKTGSIVCKCASSTNHTTNKHYTTYKNDVDYICCYLQPWDVSVIIPIEEIGDKKMFLIRKDLPKNCQNKNIHYLNNYLFDTIINN